MSSVRPHSQASYLLSPDSGTIICISSSSYLQRFSFDTEEEEWVKDDAIPQYKVHLESKLAASFGADKKICVFFQDPSGQLVCLNESFTAAVLPAKPVLGSPISTIIVNDTLLVFYISASDKCMHYLTQGKLGVGWSDQIFLDIPVEEKLKQFMLGQNKSGAIEAYIMTEEKKLLQLTTGNGKGEKTELGRVDETGKFVPGTRAECCPIVYWAVFCRPVVVYQTYSYYAWRCCW